MDQALVVLQSFSEGEGSLQLHIPMESYGLLGKGLGNGFQIESAWSEVSKDSVLQILTQVRSRLLDFILELDDQFPSELNEEQVKSRIDTIDTEGIFNNAIFGNNTTIVVGSGNNQSVNNLNLKGNFEDLAQTLKDKGVNESDVNNLREAIEKDEPLVNHGKKEYGPEVKEWLRIMLSKAVDTSWQIELGVAGSLLANALSHYYGWF
jgi:hypothetical protein